MIAYLRGTMLEKNGGTVVVLAGDVGYEVTVPISTYAGLGEEGAPVSLRIYTKVSEDSISLFGFSSAVEKLVFERLIAVSGIGPSLAVKVLSGISTGDLVNCLRAGDVLRLTKIQGVGKKTAERMILELKDKLGDLPGTSGAGPKPTGPSGNFSPLERDVLSALMNLGSPAAKAEEAVAKAKEVVLSADFEALFRKSLELVR